MLDAKKISGATKAGTAAVAAAVDQEEAFRAGMMNPPSRNPQAAWRGRQDVASATLSLTMPPSGYVPLSGYFDVDAHGDFNPNTTFPHGAPQRSSFTDFGHDPRTFSPAFNAGLNTHYSYSPLAYSSASSPAPSLRRGVLSFVPPSPL
ncbi:putative methionyl-tRNA synthetase [Hordeum vulgare]|nr:putative methionyl-tRNA synthetase [Hordeum vulgare]